MSTAPGGRVRITQLTPSGQIGGAERVLLDCLAVGDGWPRSEQSVVALSEGPMLEAASALGARAEVLPLPQRLASAGDAFASHFRTLFALAPALGSLPSFLRTFNRAVERLNPQVIHSHGIKTHLLSALLARRVPLVWHLHDYLGMRSISARLLGILARRCTLAIAVSESVAEDARRYLPARLPVVVVHNGVDCERFTPAGPELDLDALAGMTPTEPGVVRIGLPATFARWKGQDVFLEAIARLIDPEAVRAYLIGGPVYRTANSQWSEAELRTHAGRLGIAARVGFCGFIDDMPAAYRALDIVVHASTRPEPFGLVIAEAMACGRAVVASPSGGARELFVDDQHALAAPSGDARGLALALGKLVGDPGARLTMGRRARQHVIDRFGRDRFAANLRAALRPLVEGVAEAAG